MSEWGFVALGWGAGAVVLGSYVAVVLRRGRSLSRRVPPADRRWL